jgi:hypothetical protein
MGSSKETWRTGVERLDLSSGNVIFYIVEASSQEAVEDYFKDIGFAFWNTIEIRQVRPVEDIIKAVVEKS